MGKRSEKKVMRKAIKKYRILLLLEILCIFLVLPGCFTQERLVVSNNELHIGTELGITQVTSESIQLKPGVYQVRVNADIPEGNSLYINVQSEQHSFRTLRCNGSNMFANQDYLDFEVYALETIDNVYITCDFIGANQAFINSVEMYRVNWGAHMLLIVLLSVLVLIDALILFREGILNGTIKKEQQIVVWTLLASVLLAYFPYLTDYMNLGDDTAFHILRIEGLKESILQGERFPVKVQNYWLYDHGYAVSSFYGNLFLYIPVLFRLIGFSMMTSYKLFVFLVITATAIIAYYSFKKCTGHTYAALFGSLIYTLTPYRIYTIYNRGALGEFLAMAFIPLVIYGMYALYTGDVNSAKYSKAKISLAIGLSCILQSHILSCEMIIVLVLAACMMFIKKTLRKKTLLELFKTAVVCLLVNCWFWYPLFHMMGRDTYMLSEIANKEIRQMGIGLQEIFLIFPNKGTLTNRPLQVGIAITLMLCAVVIVLIRKNVFKKIVGYENSYDKSVLFWAVMTVATIVLSTQYFPWDMLAKIPGIQFFVTTLQSPTGFLALAGAFGALFAAYFILWLEKECEGTLTMNVVQSYVKKAVIATLAVLTIGASVYQVNDIAYEIQPIWLYNAENMGTTALGNGEYLLEKTQVQDYSYHDPIASEGLEWSNFEKQGNSMQIDVSNTTEQEKYLEVPVIGYEGYRVEGTENEDTMPYITEMRGAHGDLRIAIPGGYSGTLAIGYRGFFSYRIAEIISVVTIIGILLFAIKGRRSQWKEKT